jgi:hypothetical protein
MLLARADTLVAPALAGELLRGLRLVLLLALLISGACDG